MPYIVTKLEPKRGEISILDFLDDKVTLDMLKPPTKFQQTATRTDYYETIKPEKLAMLNIPSMIKVLETWYEEHKQFDLDDMNSLYTTFYVPKKKSTPENPKWRKITAPQGDFSLALTMLKDIFELFMHGCYYHTNAFAYIKGRCCRDAGEKHVKNNWFLKLDFSDFFGSTTLEFVMRMFANVFPFSEIVKVPDGAAILKRCLRMCFLDGGLPQGTPISPIITNIMMIPFDHTLSKGLRGKKVEKDGHSYGFTYTRYADDLAISCKVGFNIKEMVSNVEAVLDRYDAPFRLGHDKTQYGSNAGSNWLLGFMLTQDHKISVGYKRKKRLKAMLNNYLMDRTNGTPWELGEIQHLHGEMEYCAHNDESARYIIKNYSEKYGVDIIKTIRADLKKHKAA